MLVLSKTLCARYFLPIGKLQRICRGRLSPADYMSYNLQVIETESRTLRQRTS